MSTHDAAPMCPSCGQAHRPEERFCRSCGLPLVLGDEEAAPGEAQVRARKIDPAYTQGDLVRVAGGRNQPEAELIQGLLLEEGIPSILRRSAGFDVPDFLAAGPRDVMVPAAGAGAAREVLLAAELAPSEFEPAPASAGRFARLAAAILTGALLAALTAWVLLRIAG